VVPDLIVIRLHPPEPVAPDVFSSMLTGLAITAFDLSFADSKTGAELGTATGLADPSVLDPTIDFIDVTDTSIVQHFIDVPNLPFIDRRLESVATAVIVVDPPSGGEYPTAKSYDLRLEIARGGMGLSHHELEYNVTVVALAPLSDHQKDYFALPTSAFVTIPATGKDPALGSVDLPASGQPPAFVDLCAAIDKVLAKDPGGAAGNLAEASPLTVAQSRHIAAEIVWNRIGEPPPGLPALGIDPLGAMYTDPAVQPGLDPEDVEQARLKFEGELRGYYGIREASVLRLAGFVFSASAAIAAEGLSRAATRALFEFPVLTDASAGTTIKHAGAMLTKVGTATSAFVVPAAYFYALTANMPSQVSTAQRFDIARFGREPRLLTDFQVAEDGFVIEIPAAPFDGVEPAIEAVQAARRLHALGSAAGSAPELDPDADIKTLVEDWLEHAGPTATIDADFWEPESTSHPQEYLDLLLSVITAAHTPLLGALAAAPLNVDTVAKLVAITDEGWRDLFLGLAPHDGPFQIELLPPFTQPGTPRERTEAFIRHLRKFFEVASVPPAVDPAGAGAAPGLGLSSDDVLAAFEAAYSAIAGALTFGTPLDAAALASAAASVFPDDAAARAWLVHAIETIAALFDLTAVAGDEIHFSLMEALYARGFTSAASVAALSAAEFALALTGTVAYPFAELVHQQAGGGQGSAAEPGPFQPVNPDGLLTDCVPPPHLSPLGPVEYLHELLRVSAGSTCEQPFEPGDSQKLMQLLTARRGPLGELHATAANLDVALPVVDLVNESLELLTSELQGGGGGTGAVYDTTVDEKLGAAVPEHSSPATPVAEPDAYKVLRSDFTAPGLPYAQGLDVNRSHLEELGTTRFAAMRRFRKEITELATDAAHEPAGFQRHLWRYPVRIETALEYLRISPEEHDLLYTHDIADAPAAGQLVLHELYGFPEDVLDGRPWTEVVLELPEFLRRTGLEYCELVELWRSRFVAFGNGSRGGAFPVCEPCCLHDLAVAFGANASTTNALRRLAVLIRLWRRLQSLGEPRLTFTQLRDVCDVLRLFQGTKINPGFLPQLAAILMLRDLFCLPMSDPADESPDATGADRTHLLAFWVGPSAAKWDWAVTTLLEQIEDMADELERGRRGPDWTKVLAANLDALSVLAGFDPATPELTWHAQPTSTMRFAEILWKITLSEFTVGEVLFLFTVDDHLDGDDPFALQPRNESFDDPLQHPDDEPELGLWGLRRKLLAVEVDDDGAEAWTWARIVSTLRDEHGLPLGPGGVDRLTAIGEHLFPSVLERDGHVVPPIARQYRTPLPAGATTPAMWNTPPAGPLRYDLADEQLWTQLPLRDGDIAAKLSEIRALTAAEQAAARELYFAPRASLAPFSNLFTNFSRAVERLVAEPGEEERFRFLQREFARFELRCRVIADHLAEHAASATGRPHAGTSAAAWRLLRSLWGDENRALASWEDDSGKAPGVTWGPQPTGGAFAALLGLAGTGLLGEFRVKGSDPAWRELRGPLSAFGGGANAWNAPVPTVIPSMGLTLTPDQLRHVAVRNGFAMRDVDGEPLSGAQRFGVRWRGALLVERPGEYRFEAGAPTSDGSPPDFERAHDKSWLVTLRRGQRRWFVLNHDWEADEAPAAASEPLLLRRGAYEIEVLLEQPEPTFAREEEICPRHCGFQVKYAGPDTEDVVVAVPFDRLFRLAVDATLDDGLDVTGAARQFLRDRYTSSLRDIRRTYQRAYKAVLLAHLFELSATPLESDPETELGYMLEHAELFAGRSYPRTAPSTFGTHLAWLDPNLLPVADPHGPPPTGDERAQPSAKRRAALFDWWERLYDYDELRRETASARERPAWRMFYEATDLQPDDPAQLVRHLGVDIRHSAPVDVGDVSMLLTYFHTPVYTLGIDDLASEPWAIRVWQGEKWLRALERRFLARWIGDAEPARWAADDPDASAGNQNLAHFVREGCFESGEPRRYANVKALDDGLRERARAGLVAYLCGMSRVSLPFAPGKVAHVARDLSDLLLQDVEAGLCERASRIEDAISSVHAFVQRARLGLEPGFAVTPAFIEVWDGRFAAFNAWLCCKQREVYRENWIEWDELRQARRVEAYAFLEEQLREATLTVAVPGGLEWWPGGRPPAHPCLELLQARQPSHIRLLTPGPDPEDLDLMGTPERGAEPSWLAPFDRATRTPRTVEPVGGDDRPSVPAGGLPAGGSRTVGTRPRTARAQELQRLPLWIQAAVRLGARFVRVAAAGVPPASKPFADCAHHAPCCEECGAVHEPLVDEIYFWLTDARRFEAVSQDAAAGLVGEAEDAVQTGISGWHDPEKLPGLLEWPSKPAVHLNWSRFHNGELLPPRRSSEAVAVDESKLAAGTLPQLDFMGRTGDSLRFEVSDALAPVVGYPDPLPPGFRYDLADDAAVVLPLIGPRTRPSRRSTPAGCRRIRTSATTARGRR